MKYYTNGRGWWRVNKHNQVEYYYVPDKEWITSIYRVASILHPMNFKESIEQEFLAWAAKQPTQPTQPTP